MRAVADKAELYDRTRAHGHRFQPVAGEPEFGETARARCEK
jgi:hypothetical protein